MVVQEFKYKGANIKINDEYCRNVSFEEGQKQIDEITPLIYNALLLKHMKDEKIKTENCNCSAS